CASHRPSALAHSSRATTRETSIQWVENAPALVRFCNQDSLRRSASIRIVADFGHGENSLLVEFLLRECRFHAGHVWKTLLLLFFSKTQFQDLGRLADELVIDLTLRAEFLQH